MSSVRPGAFTQNASACLPCRLRFCTVCPDLYLLDRISPLQNKQCAEYFGQGIFKKNERYFDKAYILLQR